MDIGLQKALSEITLVFFTTLAPSGVFAYLVMCLPLFKKDLASLCRTRIDKYLFIPITVALTGLVASATHLGNAANALYVFSSVGKSPLSNEVFCAVLYFVFAGLYWLYSFVRYPKRLLQYLLLVPSCATGVLFIIAIAYAYDVDTIVSWHVWQSPASIWLNAFLAGSLLAIAGLRFAGFHALGGLFGRVLLWVAAVAYALNLAVYGTWAFALPSIENSQVQASDLVPCYVFMVGVFAVLAGFGIGIDAKAMFFDGGIADEALAGDIADEALADGIADEALAGGIATDDDTLLEESVRLADSGDAGAASDGAAPGGAAQDGAAPGGAAPDGAAPGGAAPESTLADEAAAEAEDGTHPEDSRHPKPEEALQPGYVPAIFACVLTLAGIFVMRFAFYMMHMTVGLGL